MHSAVSEDALVWVMTSPDSTGAFTTGAFTTAREKPAPPADVDPDFDARWTAWKARGASHDSAVRRNLAAMLPAIAIVAVAVYFLILMW